MAHPGDATLGRAFLADLDDRLAEVDARVARQYPGEPGTRQPVHTVYVPATRFDAELVRSWGRRARVALDAYGGGPSGAPAAFGVDAAGDLYDRVVAKLEREPVEDLRIDFEDGYGNQGDAGEDADAVKAAGALAAAIAAGTSPAVVGLRCKGLEKTSRRRGLRTLDFFLAALLERTPLPDGFVVTLPKVVAIEHVAVFAEVLQRLEQAHRLPDRSLLFEVQVETPQSVLAPDGAVAVPQIVSAAAGRCVGLHYGTYDYSAALGIPAGQQSLAHPAADFAKSLMQVSAAGTGVRVSDGSTNVLPVGDGQAVRAAWREHARLVRRSLDRGFYQGWDLHPHQLPSRYFATYAFFRDGFATTAGRLRSYAERAESGVLDEPATAQALAGFLLRGLDCGALDATEVTTATGLDRLALARYARRSPVIMKHSAPNSPPNPS